MSLKPRRSKIVAEINITPFTDVVLVLLVIFMITTPLMLETERSGRSNTESGFDVSLPEAKGQNIPSLTNHVIIAVLDDGRVVLGGEVVPPEVLREKLQRIKADNASTLVIIQADRMVNHWRVVQIMETAAEVGLKRIAVATKGK